MDKETALKLAITAQTKGGFTYCPDSGLVKGGYSVSIFPELEHTVHHKVTDIIAAAIQDYVSMHREILNSPGVHLGCWSMGHPILDCVAVVHNERAARYLATLYHQVAYYDIEREVTVYIDAGHEKLLERVAHIPKAKEVKLIHYARNRLVVLDGRLRGQNSGGESPRLGNTIPAVYLYKEGAEPERCIKTRPWICKVTANLALFNLDDKEIAFPLLAEVKAAGPSYLNAAEWAIYNAGYDGYTDDDGRVVVFNSIAVDSCERRA